MEMSAKKRRSLVSAANRMMVTATLSANDLSDGAMAHLRQCFADREVLKVRIRAADREECETAAAGIASRLPCEIVQRVGRVVTLYRRDEGADN